MSTVEKMLAGAILAAALAASLVLQWDTYQMRKRQAIAMEAMAASECSCRCIAEPTDGQ